MAEAESVTDINDGGKTAEVADVAETPSPASEGIKAKLGDTEVAVKDIASIENGEMSVALEDGSIVNADEVDFGENDGGLVFQAAKDMSSRVGGFGVDAANTFIRGYSPDLGITEAEYAHGWISSYKFGAQNSPRSALATNPITSMLTEEQRETAYNFGRAFGNEKVAQNSAKIDSTSTINAGKDSQKSPRKGKVYFDGAKYGKTLNERQRASLKALNFLSKALGVDIYIMESERVNGKRIGENGWYDPTDRSIHIDLYAGAEAEALMLYTAAHEMTHHLREVLPEKFNVLADAIFEEYTKRYGDHVMEDLIKEKTDFLKAKGRITENMTEEEAYDLAYEEVIADCCETMLTDSNAMEALSKNIHAKDKGLWNAIKRFFADLIERIKAAYKDVIPDSEEGQRFRVLGDGAERIKKLWVEAIVEASEVDNSSEIIEIDMNTESVAPMFSERTWNKSEYVTEREETAKKISKAIGVDTKTAYKYIDDINGVARLIADDRARLDYEPNLDENASVLKPNKEYKYSVDMSTLCAKRLLFTGTFDAIQRALPNTVFDSEDIVALREMMQKRDYEVACGICYVESTRREIGRITQEFIDRYKVAQETGQPISRINSSGKEVVLKSAGRTFSADKNYTPNLGELNTTDIDIVKRDHREVYDAYLAFMNARGQAKPKLLETRAEYKGEILKHFKAKSAVEARNNAGGLRLQSFSDFEVPHMIDMMQIVMDMSRVGLKSQAYTKVPAFAEIFGDSGVKINLSLIAKGDGLDANGNLVFDDVEGINHKEAFKLRDKYSKNVGTILVGKTDAHIIAAMADPRIDYIIPFHKSSWKESLYDALGLTGYADYTDYQNEKPIDKDRKIKNFDPSEYWDFTKSGDENAQIYLEKCREDGRIPKFPQFQGYPGYWKLLIDFKMYDNDGVGTPQEVVKPIFNTEASERILGEYKGGHKSFPVAKDVVEDFVKEHKDKVKYADRASEKSDFATYMLNSFGIKKLDDSVHIQRQVLATLLDEGFFADSEARSRTDINEESGLVIETNKSGIDETFGFNNFIRLGKFKKIAKLATIRELPNIIKHGHIVADDVANKYDSADKNKKFAYIEHSTEVDGKEIVVKLAIKKSPQKNKFWVHSIYTIENVSDSPASTNEGTEAGHITADSKGIIPQNSDSVKGKNKNRLNSDRPYQKASYAPTFYSQMGEVIDDIKLEKMGTPSVLNHLKNRGVKNEEIKWSGIEAFLEGKKSVTKAELQEFVAGSQLQIEEELSGRDIELRYDHSTDSYTVLDGEGDVIDTYSYDADRGGYTSENDDEVYEYASDLEKEMRWVHGVENAPRHSQYKLEGGTNYRELVFKLPNSTYSNNAMRGHWGQDAEGVLAHARIQDFDVNGKKMLFIEEIQSDWHNEGREKGYTTKEYEDAVAVYDKLAEDYANKRRAFNKYVRSGEFRSDPDEVSKKKFDWLRSKMETAEKRMQAAERDVEALKEKGMGDVPDAPFRTNYHEYVLKRLLRMAAEEGYDSIGWTTADIQSERWSDDYAEGYRIEYDQDIPSFLKKYGKKWGATVGKDAIGGNGEVIYTDAYGENFPSIRAWVDFEIDHLSYLFDSDYSNRLTVKEDGNILSLVDKHTGRVYANTLTVDTGDVEVWSMDITDSMRESVLYEGQPLYQDRNTNGMKNRTLLANALETAAQNDIERNKLKQYKEKIELISTEEQKLHDIREQIKELSFAKGPRDTEAIKKLQFEANQAANRINTYDRQLLNLEATTALKGVLEREKAQARKRAEQKAEQRRKDDIARVKERAAKTQRELMDRYQKSRKKGIEGRKKTEMRHKIKDVVNELNQHLTKGTKEKHVPIELQKAVAEALDAVNMDTVGAEERIAKLQEELRTAKTLEDMKAITKKIERIQEMGGNLEAKLSRLKTAYDSIINSDDPLIANSHDDVISSSIDKVIEVVGNTPLRDMSLYQLESVYDMYKMVLTSVRNANKAFKAAKGEEISTIANGVIAELMDKKKKSPYSAKGMQAMSEFDWNNLKPVYAFERIGSANFTKVFKEVRAGEDVWANDMSEAQAFREEQFKKYKYDSWDFNKRYGFTSTSGMHFELSLDQILSLYAFSKRDQAADHLKYGGFVFDGLTEVKEKNKVGVTVTYQLKDATAYNLSEETLAEIIGKLTPEQKAFADAMQDYLSTVMGEKGNEVSLALYDIKLFKEKHYFPLKSAPQYMAKAKEQAQGEVKIKNKGFTKETTPKAKNPIVLSSFMDVWAGHVNEMSMYHAFTLPLEDFYRVYNYHTSADEKMEMVSVGASLENAHGEAAVKYIDQLLKDLNGGARSDPRETFGKALMSNFKKAAVMASMSVVVQQPTAIVRAMALVDAKHFAGQKVAKGKHKEMWAEVKKYAPVAVIKEMGYFDTGMGKGSVEWLKGEKTFMDKVDDVISKAPALADEVTWVAIWNAVKRETVHTHKDLRSNSEEFLKVVGERFTEVIIKTQVYDSTLSRSANMRSKGALMNMWTAFMAEPTTSINMLQDAFRKGNKKYIARTLGAVYGSVILNSALVSLIYAMRDDDEDETFLEKYLSRFTTEVIDGINPITYIPFFKDIWSLLQGFDVERADMSLINDVIDSLQQIIKVASKDTSDMDEDELSEHNKAINEAVLSIIDNISSLVGVPVKNVRRDINGFINSIKTIEKDLDGRETTAGSLGDNVLEDVKDSVPVWGWFPDESKGDKLYDATIKGDTAYIDRLKSAYKSENAYNSAVRKALQENDPRIKEAAQAVVDGNFREYDRIRNEIDGEGHFGEKDIRSAIAAEVEKMTPDEPAEEKVEKEESDYAIEWVYTAVSMGDVATAKAMREEMIETHMANGKSRDEAEASFNSSFTGSVKKYYEKGEISAYEAKNMLKNFAGSTETKATSKIQYWDYVKKNPDASVDDAWFVKYNTVLEEYGTSVANSGISVDMYIDYRIRVKDIDGENKKRDRMAVISSLPISTYQKDALYFAEGWKRSKLYEAPWH